MQAAVFDSRSARPGHWLSIENVPQPEPQPGHILLKVIACGVCRTDLHIVEGDLPPIHPRIIPGHQIVGEVVDGATAELPLRSRAGVSWIGGVDGDCWYCRHAMENLCDHPLFTGYSVNGGYAEYASVRADFAFPLPATMKRRPGRSAAVRRHHRISQPEGSGSRTRRASRAIRFRQFRVACDSYSSVVGLRGIRRHPWRIAPQSR